MSATMLQLVQQAANELGIAAPSTVAGNTNQDVVQMLALLNASGYELMDKHAWRGLTKIHQFYTEYVTTTGSWVDGAYTITGIPSTTGLDTTYGVVGPNVGIPQNCFIASVDSATQVTLNQTVEETETSQTVYFQKMKYSLPSDYQGPVNRTQWDKSKHWEMLGPTDAQQWEWLTSGFISTGPRVRWRLLGQYFQIWPGFSNAEFLGFEYVSNSWASSAAGVAKSSFTVDTDTCIYPDRLMVIDLKLKYFEAKGFDTTSMYRDFLTQLEAGIAKDQGAANLSFAPRPGELLIGWDQIPDSGYGITS